MSDGQWVAALRPRALAERARGSLFLTPTAFALGGVVLGIVALIVDDQLTSGAELPFGVATTADSARSVLSTVASATMTFAGIVFSVTLLVFQMSSSQYSPRVIHGLFRDKFNKRVIGLVVGTFTYCLVVLRSVHGPIEAGPGSAIPTFSVSLAVLLGVTAVLAMVAFIDHNAHRMDVSQILDDITDETRERAGDQWWPDGDEDEGAEPPSTPVGPGHVVTAVSAGWVQQVDAQDLLDALPPDGLAVMETAPGRYAALRSTLCIVWPAVGDDDDETADRVRSAILIGAARTVTQDPAYGLRQMVDVTLKALSPGINDPTTAQDSLFHIADALVAVLTATPPPSEIRGAEGRRIVLKLRSRPQLVELAFDEIRRAAAPHPAVTAYLFAAIEIVARAIDGIPEELAVRDALRQVADLAVAESEHVGVPLWDLSQLRRRRQRLDLR